MSFKIPIQEKVLIEIELYKTSNSQFEMIVNPGISKMEVAQLDSKKEYNLVFKNLNNKMTSIELEERK